MTMRLRLMIAVLLFGCVLQARAAREQAPAGGTPAAAAIGREIAVPVHLRDGQEFTLSTAALLAHGQLLFDAKWTDQEGAGRPLTKGTGRPLSDPSQPLSGMRTFNRISAPDASACTGCHNAPHGLSGGGGDAVTNVFVLGQRFDSVTFAGNDSTPTKSSVDEKGRRVNLQNVANSRSTIGMFGSGYIEMLARQITADLQAIRDSLNPGDSKALVSKGISFGMLGRRVDGTWDTSQVEGLGAVSLVTTGPGDPPNLIIRPFHKAGRVGSLREFTNNAFNHHHGIQSTERFGKDTDPDGDGVMNEMSRAEVTATVIFQATLAVPVSVIPDDPGIAGGGESRPGEVYGGWLWRMPHAQFAARQARLDLY